MNALEERGIAKSLSERIMVLVNRGGEASWHVFILTTN